VLLGGLAASWRPQVGTAPRPHDAIGAIDAIGAFDLPLVPFAGAALIAVALAFLARGGISPRKRPRAAPRWPFAPRTDLLADRAIGLVLGGAVLAAGTASLFLLGISAIYRGGAAGVPPTLAGVLGPAVAVAVGLAALDGIRRYRAFLARHRRSDREKRREDQDANGSPEVARARDRERLGQEGGLEGAPAAVVVADGAADSPAYCIYFRSIDRAPWIGAVVPRRELPADAPAPFHDPELTRILAELPRRAPIPEAHFAALARAFPRG
jgi:membrane protein implicated in regulation of membrane protease activity